MTPIRAAYRLSISASLGVFLSAASVAQNNEINLESTFKGNREQPRVLYIVPWQQAGGSPVSERPISGELDQLFQPIDRTSFQRELQYLEFLGGEDAKTDNLPLFD